MVHHHNGIAISLYELKAIRREFADEGGYLIFELNNALSLIEDMETGQWVERSHQNEACHSILPRSSGSAGKF